MEEIECPVCEGDSCSYTGCPYFNTIMNCAATCITCDGKGKLDWIDGLFFNFDPVEVGIKKYNYREFLQFCMEYQKR